MITNETFVRPQQFEYVFRDSNGSIIETVIASGNLEACLNAKSPLIHWYSMPECYIID